MEFIQCILNTGKTFIKYFYQSLQEGLVLNDIKFIKISPIFE